ncbi:MAG: hypothetical protein EBR82_18285 [Caulobacteraceae bacterium]|nr:hypothetical protein [Caulobacteraceae bacterium]
MLKSSLQNAAGNRNNYVTVERASNGAPNGSYEVPPVFTQVYQGFSETVYTSGREFMMAMQVQPMLNAIMKLPYDENSAQITARDRINDGGVTMNIDAVFNEGTNNEKIVLWLVQPG